MAAIKKQLAQITQNSGSSNDLYMTPSIYTTILKEITICNPSNSDVYFTLGIKGSEANGLNNAIFYKAYILAGQTNIMGLSSVVPTGKTIYVKTDAVTTGGALNIIVSGVEILNSSGKQLVTTMLPVAITTPLYTVPSGKTAVLYQAMFTNGSSSATTVTMYIVPPLGTLIDDNLVLVDIPVESNETLIYAAATGLLAGSTIYAQSSTTNSINLTIDGTEK